MVSANERHHCTRSTVDHRWAWDPALIHKYDVPGPRYTSYPSAMQFRDDFDPLDYQQYLLDRPPSNQALSLYVHIPFCRDICYYCACNKTVTREAGVAETYLSALQTEADLLGQHLERGRKITQLNWGGGTPTYLTAAELTRLMYILSSHFTLIDSPQREYSIELDPRTVDTSTVALLKGLGFNRVSLGIQDFDANVQRAIHREQSIEWIAELMQALRGYQFKSISFDLIYGLPRQTLSGFQRTVEQVIELSPDRIACYSYAHLPGRFPSQRSIDRLDVPSAGQKIELLLRMVEQLTAAGYVHIGMDQFTKPEDDLARAMNSGQLQRNFQGYSTQMAPELVGLGVSSISHTGDHYIQNAKSLDRYYTLLKQGQLPVERGLALSAEDQLRRAVIMQLACGMKADGAQIGAQFGIDFVSHFANEMVALRQFESDQLVSIDDHNITVTPTGRPLIRNICLVFDAYQDAARHHYSKTI